MNKKTQMIVGVIAVAGISYWLLTKNKKDKVFANAVGDNVFTPTPIPTKPPIQSQTPAICPPNMIRCPKNKFMCYNPKDIFTIPKNCI